MKILKFLFTAFVALSLTACGGDAPKDGGGGNSDYVPPAVKAQQEAEAAAANAMSNIGVGPLTSAITLDAAINDEMAATGKEIYELKCTACHKAEKKFIGPAPKGILERRNPTWVMNMILDPEKMVQEDPIAKALLMEFNGSPMANQSLTQEEARAVLEYFRTL